MPAISDQPARVDGGGAEAAELDVLLERLPPRVAGDPPLRAGPRACDATSARRMLDSSSVGTLTYCAIRRRIDRERTSNAVRIAKPSSASTETITKTMRNGERITWSIQRAVERAEPRVERSERRQSSSGVVYVAVAAATPATAARTVAFVSGGSSDV